MTNKDYFLKDNVSVEELIKQLYEVQDNNYNTNMFNCKKFFEQEATPTLTEDERVILRNIDKNYSTIGRKLGGALYLRLKSKIALDSTFEDFFGNLFQFIKERRRIRDTRIIRRVKMTRTVETKLLCPRCRNCTTIFRKASKQKEEGHYKNLYCYICKANLNHIELKLNKIYTEAEIEALIEKMKSENRYDYF